MPKPRGTHRTPPRARRAERNAQEAITRRVFIRGVVAVSAAAAVAGLPAPTAGALAPAPVLGLPPDRRMLALVLDRLIPADGQMPAAGELGIAGVIEDAMGVAPHLRSHIARLFATLPDDVAFGQWTPSEADAALGQLEASQRDSFDILLQAAYVGYYGHPTIQNLLGWVDPVDTGYQAPQFDATSLDDLQLTGWQESIRIGTLTRRPV